MGIKRCTNIFTMIFKHLNNYCIVSRLDLGCTKNEHLSILTLFRKVLKYFDIYPVRSIWRLVIKYYQMNSSQKLKNSYSFWIPYSSVFHMMHSLEWMVSVLYKDIGSSAWPLAMVWTQELFIQRWQTTHWPNPNPTWLLMLLLSDQCKLTLRTE